MNQNNTRKTNRKRLQGTVVSDKVQKMRIIDVTRLVRNPIYSKVTKKRKKFYAHDENGISKTGDFVIIEETRPISKLKKWRVVKVVK
ncbi:MAG: 30S ribosomal protein S17 [Elusimicrobiota bacterium]